MSQAVLGAPMPLTELQPHRIEAPPRRRRFQLLRGVHHESQGLARNPDGTFATDENGRRIMLPEKIYTAGDVLESDVDLCKMHNGMQGSEAFIKFREVSSGASEGMPVSAAQLAFLKEQLRQELLAEMAGQLAAGPLPTGGDPVPEGVKTATSQAGDPAQPLPGRSQAPAVAGVKEAAGRPYITEASTRQPDPEPRPQVPPSPQGQQHQQGGNGGKNRR